MTTSRGKKKKIHRKTIPFNIYVNTLLYIHYVKDIHLYTEDKLWCVTTQHSIVIIIIIKVYFLDWKTVFSKILSATTTTTTTSRLMTSFNFADDYICWKYYNQSALVWRVCGGSRECCESRGEILPRTNRRMASIIANRLHTRVYYIYQGMMVGANMAKVKRKRAEVRVNWREQRAPTSPSAGCSNYNTYIHI